MLGLKLLITAGCSFTEVPLLELHNSTFANINNYSPDKSLSWPIHLNNYLGTIPLYKGKGASGNGIISKTVIYEVSKALKTYDSSEILVGIMWSGYYRHELYFTDRPTNFHEVYRGVENQSNPSSIGTDFKYYKVMPYWDDELSKMFYKNVYDDIGSYIQTLEHILRVQWFLKQYNIKYFMTCYYPRVFPVDIEHNDLKHLYELIDFDNFLDVGSEYEWCAKYKDPSLWNPIHNVHPDTELHKAFTDHVIIPHLRKKGYIK